MTINPPLCMPATKSELLDYSYELYKIDWLVSHGFNLTMLMKSIADYIDGLDDIDEYPLIGDSRESSSEIMDDWENEIGFPGAQIWACKDEFEECEYNDNGYMAGLLPKKVYALYKKRDRLPD